MTEATKKGASRREQDMERILLARAEEQGIKEEGTPTEELETVSEAIEQEEPIEGIAEQEKPVETPVEPEMVEFTDESGTVYKVPKSAKTKLKIDGQEEELSADKVVRSYQKGAAGDKRLAEAADMMKRLAVKESELTLKEQNFQKQMMEANKQKAAGELSPDDHREKVKQLMSALIDADEDTAVKLWGEVTKPQPTGHLSLDDLNLDREIESRIERREYQRSLKTAQEKFREEYSDLAGDDALFEMVDRKTILIKQTMPNADPWKIIDTAAKEVRAWRDGIAGKPNGQPAKSKRTLPTPASGRMAIGGDKPEVQTREDYIAEMRKARRQAV